MSDSMLIEDTPPEGFRARGAPSAALPGFALAGLASLAGAFFSGVSTADFVAHLDRQVHQIHCSLVPGAAPQLGESGCRTIMLSPYSSWFRDSLWGGLPLSLMALAVFVYLVFRAVDFGLTSDVTRKHTAFFMAAHGLPVVMSAIYFYISSTEIGAVCKMCVGVYVASVFGLIGSVVAHVRAPRSNEPAGASWARWFVEGVAYVGVLVLLYLGAAPTSEKSLEGCGTLVKADDTAKIMVNLSNGRTKAIAVLDPLCPACRAFDDRLGRSGLMSKLDLDAVLFPLDAKCNWMLKTSLHPGACAVTEAMLCDRDRARDILKRAFENQEDWMNRAKNDEAGFRSYLATQFPSVKGCLGTNEIKNKVTKSLKWAVNNALPVLTPQLFIGDRRVCDEDTDLGLEYTLTKMLERAGAGGARAQR
ncbi:MAG: thioredoxin domain-containing protein [Deltaproteobacteria bacterium]|nr:thioredoxin domain-containing protein [Deltaproteobacteria bacterium]